MWAVTPLKKDKKMKSIILLLRGKQIEQMGTWGNCLRLRWEKHTKG
jgi:hypothetical protein